MRRVVSNPAYRWKHPLRLVFHRSVKALLLLSLLTTSNAGINIHSMKSLLLPHTRFGRWSLSLLVCFLIFWGLIRLSVALGQSGGDTFFSNPLLSILGLLAFISGVGAFFTGVFSVIKSRERSVAVFVSTLVGLFLLVLIIGEVFIEQ